MKHLLVTSSEIKEDKNGKEYNLIGLSTPPMVNGLKMPVRETRITAYKENYLPVPKQDFGWDAKANDKLAGDLITREVEAYDIEGREVTSATVFVAGNTDDPGFEILVKRAFASKGFILGGANQEEEVAEAAVELQA